MNDTYAFSFENAGFSYDGVSFVFRNIDLHVNVGEFICIIGSNGSGKSTLAKHLNALLVPDEGDVFVRGNNTNIHDLVYIIRSQTGFVFQNPDDQIIASLVENDVAFGPENQGVDEKDLRLRVQRALAGVDLDGFEKREVSSLSGGQKQRLAIAGVLAMNPALLILDEASAMLDPQGRAELMRIVKDLHNLGMTIVMITHFMEEAAQAQRIVVLENGSICMDGTPRQVFAQNAKLRSLHLAPPLAARISGALQAQGIPIQICITAEELEKQLCTLNLTM